MNPKDSGLSQRSPAKSPQAHLSVSRMSISFQTRLVKYLLFFDQCRWITPRTRGARDRSSRAKNYQCASEILCQRRRCNCQNRKVWYWVRCSCRTSLPPQATPQWCRGWPWSSRAKIPNFFLYPETCRTRRRRCRRLRWNVSLSIWYIDKFRDVKCLASVAALNTQQQQRDFDDSELDARHFNIGKVFKTVGKVASNFIREDEMDLAEREFDDAAELDAREPKFRVSASTLKHAGHAIAGAAGFAGTCVFIITHEKWRCI